MTLEVEEDVPYGILCTWDEMTEVEEPLQVMVETDPATYEDGWTDLEPAIRAVWPAEAGDFHPEDWTPVEWMDDVLQVDGFRVQFTESATETQMLYTGPGNLRLTVSS